MASKRWRNILLLILIALLPLGISIRMTPPCVHARGTLYEYEDGDYIPLFANKIGPINNSCEAYPYYELPFCPPGDPISKRKKSFQELLSGGCFTNTQYELKFKVEAVGKILCEKYLTEDEVVVFRYAVRRNFEYHMYYNNILLKGPVGKVVEENGDNPRYYLFKHINFYPLYSGKQVKGINIASDDFDSAVDITEDAEIGVSFTYSVFWNEFEENQDYYVFQDECSLDRYWRPKHDQGVRDFDMTFYLCISIAIWFGLLLVVIWALLRNSFTWSSVQVSKDMNSTLHMGIHGDGCRCPPNSSLLGAFLGNGTQILVLIGSFLILSYRGVLYPCNPKAVFTYILTTYCVTSAAAGYVATAFHSEFSWTGWKQCIFQTGVLYSVPSALTGLLLYTLQGLTSGFLDLLYSGPRNWFLPICGLSAIILLCLGGTLGYYVTPKDQAPCAITRFQRHISGQPWYLRTPAQMFFGGLLPFTAIFWLMDDIYASLWNKKVCGAFRTMLSAFFVVVSLTVFLAMAFTRYQLSKQDHDWWWRSWLRGGSPAIFMFAYGIYFHARISGDDFMNLVLVMGYDACIFYAFFLALGTIGYFASSAVFQHMYQGLQKYE